MKKFLATILTLALFSTLLGCNLLSTIIAVKDFSVEYPAYSQIYNDTTYMTVSSDTQLTVSQTTIPGLESMTSNLYMMIDHNTPYTYLEETLNDVSTKSLLESTDSLLIEYLINGDVVTPTIPTSDKSTSASDIFTMDNLTLSDVQNEYKIAEHQYAFDIYLNQVVNLNNLAAFTDQLKLFDENLTALDNAQAHVIISFTEVESVIDIQATLTDYEIVFDDTSSVTFSLENHTILKIPTDFQMPDVFSDEYQMVAVDDIRLAKKSYVADTSIVIPVKAQENGWLKVELEAGTYDLISSNWGLFSASKLYNSLQEEVPYNAVDMIQVTIEQSGTYYFYLVPTSDLTLDLTFQKVVE